MKRAITAGAVGLLGLFLFQVDTYGQTNGQKSEAPSYENRDGYQVLSVVLNSQAIAWKNDTMRIDPLTASGEWVAQIKAQCMGIPAEFQGASQDFDRKVKTKFMLEKSFSLSQSYELTHPSSVTKPTQMETKEQARNRIRSGTYHLAAVGFDDERTHAVAFVEYICGHQCGSSIFYYLRKTEKGWEEAREVKSCGRIY